MRQLNEDQGRPAEPGGVRLIPILSRFSFRIVYAPPIYSRTLACLIAGQALELSATKASSSSDQLRISLDADQVDRYARWIQALAQTLGNPSEPPAPPPPSSTRPACPSHTSVFHSFFIFQTFLKTISDPAGSSLAAVSTSSFTETIPAQSTLRTLPSASFSLTFSSGRKIPPRRLNLPFTTSESDCLAGQQMLSGPCAAAVCRTRAFSR